ncbi:MAG: YfhO family protein [Anaerolineae bacterium]|nr:YfhO family protein [Anaerolineae bacterium]
MEHTFERRPWLLPVVLALLTVILLKPVIVPPGPDQALDSNDLPAQFYPFYTFVRQSLQAGELPLWNPHQFIGYPVAGNPQIGLFYPATWLTWLVGVARGLNLSLAFHTWLAAWGMARLIRRFGSSYVGALLTGIIYAMSGFAGARYFAGHYTLLLVFAWIPWVMVAYLYALDRCTWRATLPGIAALGLAILAGHPPMLVYLGLCLVALWLWYVAQTDDLRRAAWDAGERLIVIAIGGAILGAALILPAAELTGLSSRGGNTNDLAFINSFALPPAQVIGLALPNFFGNPKTGPSSYPYWGADFFQEFAAYAGLLPLLAIPLAFRLPRRRESWFFIGLAALGLILSIGMDGALLPILTRWVPGFSLFRSPGRSLYFTMFGMAGLTALLITALQASTSDERHDLLRPAIRLWIPIGLAIAFIGALIFAGWYASASHVEPMPVRAFAISNALAEAGLFLLGVWVVLWLWVSPDPKALRWAALATVVLVTLDAWHVAIPIISVGEVREPTSWAGARTTIPIGADSRLIGPGGSENLASVTGHLNVQGYDPLVIETYRKLQALGDPSDPTSPVNTLLGVRYIMTTKPYDKPNFELIGITDNNFYYRRKDAFPRVWIAKNIVVEPNDDAVRERIASGKDNLQDAVFVDRPVDCPSKGGTAAITDYRPDSVTIKTSGDGGLLALSDQFYPGWQATVDGQPATIVRTDTTFRGVCVPGGDHTVRYEYRPIMLYGGVSVSVAGWLVVLVLISIRRR